MNPLTFRSHYLFLISGLVLTQTSCQSKEVNDRGAAVETGRDTTTSDKKPDGTGDQGNDGGSGRNRTQEHRSEDQQNAIVDTGPTASLRVLETTDLHVWMENFDYYKNAPTGSYGLVRTALLIESARAEVEQSILVDNGDVIQGNPLGDYAFKSMNVATDVHPVYKAMNLLNYDVGNIGNHEFNYGLEHLRASLSGARFPYISANTFVDDGDGDPNNDQHFLPPYQIVTRELKLSDGTTQKVKVGFIGFVPPQIMLWDRSNLAGKLRSADIVDTAKATIEKVRAEGADFIIAIPHSGISAAPRQGGDENAVYYLTEIPGIDAVLSGHSHQIFPSPTYANIPNTDLQKGLINGVPVVMPGSWGSHLGVVDFDLKLTKNGWKVINAKSEARGIAALVAGAASAPVRAAVAADHQATLTYLQQEVGETATPIQSYFSQLVPTYAVQLINDAQKWQAAKVIAESGDQYASLRGLPILSACAPLKAGGKPDNYTDVAAGKLTLRSVADLYVYPNTLKVVKMTGAQVQEWLEMSAGAFNQVKPNEAAEQPLLNPMFPGYNFDIISGLTYRIDVSVAARYNKLGQIVDANAHRILNLQFAGVAIDPAQEFLVATNNYRASGGGAFPGLNGSSIVIDGTYENREVLRDYVAATGIVGQSLESNWSVAPVAGASNVIFKTAPLARSIAAGLVGVTVSDAGDGPDGFANFKLVW